jgi:hypothetical protein
MTINTLLLGMLAVYPYHTPHDRFTGIVYVLLVAGAALILSPLVYFLLKLKANSVAGSLLPSDTKPKTMCGFDYAQIAGRLYFREGLYGQALGASLGIVLACSLVVLGAATALFGGTIHSFFGALAAIFGVLAIVFIVFVLSSDGAWYVLDRQTGLLTLRGMEISKVVHAGPWVMPMIHVENMTFRRGSRFRVHVGRPVDGKGLEFDFHSLAAAQRFADLLTGHLRGEALAEAPRVNAYFYEQEWGMMAGAWLRS